MPLLWIFLQNVNKQNIQVNSCLVFVRSVLLYFLVFLCCPIMYLSLVLWCPHGNDICFVFTSSCLWKGSSLIYVICVCLCIMVLCICFSCLRLVCPMLSVFLDCPLWLPLWYCSLTLISNIFHTSIYIYIYVLQMKIGVSYTMIGLLDNISAKFTMWKDTVINWANM